MDLDRWFEAGSRALDSEARAVRHLADDSQLYAPEGVCVAKSPEGMLYRFTVAETPKVLAAETPAQVTTGGLCARGHVDRVHGFDVYLVLDGDLGPYPRRATIALDLSFLLRKLRDVLDSYVQGTRDFARELIDDLRQGTWRAVPIDPKGPAGIQTAWLNAGQAAAVKCACGSNVSFIWGPPGTGKSHTLGVLVSTLVRAGERVLVSSHTNVAVDNALEKACSFIDLESAGEDAILRYGPAQALPDELAHRLSSRDRAEQKLPPDARPSQLRRTRARVVEEVVQLRDEVESLLAQHPSPETADDWTERAGHIAEAVSPSAVEQEILKAADDADAAQAVRKRLRRRDSRSSLESLNLSELVAELNEHARASPALGRFRDVLVALADRVAQLDVLIDAATQLVVEIESALVASAKVVGATLCKSYLSAAIVDERFDAVIVDEASMASLPQIAAVAGRANKRIVVVGDFRQLAPIAQTEEEAHRRFLTRDVFVEAGIKDAVEHGESHPGLAMLDEQYRMHPGIAVAPSKLFYQGRLRDAAPARGLVPVQFRPAPQGHGPVVTVETSTSRPWCLKAFGRHSRFNLFNATTAVAVVRSLVGSDLRSDEIGVVTPYRAQCRVLRRLLVSARLSETTVATVHRFQGLEATAIVLDLVDSEPHRIGRLLHGQSEEGRDEVMRLLNVAITRARRALIVVADRLFLKRKTDLKVVGGNPLGRLLEEAGYKPPLVRAGTVLRECQDRFPIGTAESPRKLAAMLPRGERLVLFTDAVDLRPLEDFLAGLEGFRQVSLVVRGDTAAGSENRGIALQVAKRFANVSAAAVHGPCGNLCLIPQVGVRFFSTPPLKRGEGPIDVYGAESPDVAAELERLLRVKDLVPGGTAGPRACSECGELVTVKFEDALWSLACGCGGTGLLNPDIDPSRNPLCPRCQKTTELRHDARRGIGFTCPDDPWVWIPLRRQ